MIIINRLEYNHSMYKFKNIDDYGPILEEVQQMSPKNLREHTRYCYYYKFLRVTFWIYL